MFGGHLKREEDSLDLVEVAAGRGGVCEGQLELFVGPDDENAANSEGVVSVGVDHPVKVGDFAVVVAEDGISHFHVLSFFDILHPTVVVLHRVHRKRNHLRIHGLKFGLQPGNGTELCRAHGLCTPIKAQYYVSTHMFTTFEASDRPLTRLASPESATHRVVFGMGEKNAPAISKVLVELDCTVGRVLFEVRNRISEFDIWHGEWCRGNWDTSQLVSTNRMSEKQQKPGFCPLTFPLWVACH